MSRVSVTFKYIGRLLKFLIFCIVFTVIIFLLWRISSMGTPDSMEALIVDDELRAIYAENDGELDIFTQKQLSMTSAQRNRGYFGIPATAFIPEANQIQIIFRYNNSTIKSIAKDYQLEEVPNRDEDIFKVSLLLQIDATPENKEDNSSTDASAFRYVRCEAREQKSDKKNLYNFRRFVFDFDSAGVDIAELIEKEQLIGVYADVYFIDNFDYENKPDGSLLIYQQDKETLDVKLSKEDKKNLE